MIHNQRIIWDDNGTEKDLSVNLNNFRSGVETFDFTSADDKLYIASYLPFNHRHFEIDTANDAASVVSVDIWYSREWVPAVDIIDKTDVSGATLAQSGVIQWKTDRQKGWDRELDSEDVAGVDKVGLYNMFWARFSFSSNLNSGTKLKFIGHKFTTDSVLYDYYPDLNNANLRNAFEPGKTDWTDQHFMAAKDIIDDLKRSDIIVSSSQILDYERLEEVSVHKCAEIIYRGMGRAYAENKRNAKAEYDDAFSMTFFNIDLDGDGLLSDKERRQRVGFVSR